MPPKNSTILPGNNNENKSINPGDASSSVPNENSNTWLGEGTLSKRLDHFNLQVKQWININLNFNINCDNINCNIIINMNYINFNININKIHDK